MTLQSHQYLTFRLDEETFALAIERVREVLDSPKITPIPQAPSFMLGVINLRGRVLPVMDLRRKFGLDRTRRPAGGCIVVTEVDIDGVATMLGALTDSVEEVLDLEPDQIEPPPVLGRLMSSSCIQGMGKHQERFVIILAIDQVFSAEDLAAIPSPETAATAAE